MLHHYNLTYQQLSDAQLLSLRPLYSPHSTGPTAFRIKDKLMMCRNLTGIDFILFDCELSIVKQIGVSPGNFNSYNSIINKSTNPDRSLVWQYFYPQVQENWAEKWLNLTNGKSFLTVNMNLNHALDRRNAEIKKCDMLTCDNSNVMQLHSFLWD